MDDSFGGNNEGNRARTPNNQQQRRGRSPLPRGESDRSPYTPNRRRSPSRSESPENHEIVPVHPSHRGSTYQRKPKKKKKKKRAVSVKQEEDVEAYYLAPVDPNSPNFKHHFAEDDEMKMNAGGKAGAMGYTVADYEGNEGSQAGMDDMEQGPEDEESAEKTAQAYGAGGELLDGEEEPKPKKKRKRQPASDIETLESGLSVRKKKYTDYELDDYDKLAQVENLVYTGQANLQGEEIDPNALLEPHQQDIDPEGDQITGVGILSYKKVKMHQYKMHPRDRKNKTKFPWKTSDISFIPCCKSQVKKSTWVTPCAKEIGLGPTLFLMTQKALTYLFLLFLIISFPLFFFYARGNGPAGGGTESKQITDYIAMISLGNMGTNEYTCSNVNMGKNEKTFRFVCPYGTMREFTEFGLQKYDNQSCTYDAGQYLGENNKWDDLQFDCTYDLGMTELGKQEIQDTFQSQCYDQTECNVKIMYSWFNEECRNRLEYYAAGSKFDDFAQLKNWTYWQRDYRRREPVIFAHALCVADKIFNPFTAKELPFQKSSFIYFLLIVDFVIVGISIWFLCLLDVRYNEYAELFDQRSVEMRDFTLKFGNLPDDWVYGGKDLMLQCRLWNHIEHHLRVSFEQKCLEGGNVELLEKIQREKSWEVVDVTFGKNDDKESVMLGKLDELDRAKKTKIHQVQQAAKEGKPANDALGTQIVDDIKAFKELKSEYIHLQEEKLYEQWEINDFNGRSKSDHSNLFAFVTFRSMKGKKRAEKIFTHAEANAKIYSEENEKKFFEKFLAVGTVCSPSSFKWNNISVTYCNRLIRSIIIWTIAIGMIVLAFYLMVVFKDWNDSIKAELSTKKCPSQPVPADLAFEDWTKPGKQRGGLFHCFCLTAYNDFGGDVSSTLADFLEVNPGLDEDPCGDWKFVYENSMYLVIITGAMIGLLNTICVVIFEIIVMFEKCLTFETETKAQFNRMVTIQYMNIALVLIFADFSLGTAKQGTGFAILQGNYKDFDTSWYKDVGAKITMAMVSNSIAPFFAKLFEPILVPVLRCFLDRSLKKHLRKKTNIEEEIKKVEEQHKADVKAGKKKGPPPTPVATPRGGAAEEEAPPEESPEGEDEQTQNEGGQDDEAPAEEAAEEGEYDEEEETPGTAQPQEGEVFEYEDCDDDEPESKTIFQDDLNELYLNKLVQCFYIYLWFFTNFLIYYSYSGSMPLMYGLGALHFFLAYLSYKFLFIDFYRISYGFDDDIPKYALGLMKYGILFHLVFNVFMYTNKRILTPAVYDTDIHYRQPNENAGRFFQRRFDIFSSRSVIWFALVIVICYCIYKCIICPILYICQVQEERRKAKQEEEAEEELPPEGDDEEAMALKNQIADDFSADFYKELNIHFLRDLYIRSQKEYELFRTMVNAISYDTEILSDEQAKQYKKCLKLRIQTIEDTIDVHLNLIGGLEKYMDKSYLYKLAVLDLNEEKIVANDPKSQRLVDIVQSFYIYEQMDFGKHKLIQNRIDREILELDFVDKDQPVYC